MPDNPKSKIIKSGNGWRLGCDVNAAEYQGLVGGDNWAIELTQAELNDFCRLLDRLVASIEQISQELMDEEKIACEVESDLLWMQVEGYPYAYSLQFILKSGRCAEGSWPAEVVPHLAQAAQVFFSNQQLAIAIQPF